MHAQMEAILPYSHPLFPLPLSGERVEPGTNCVLNRASTVELLLLISRLFQRSFSRHLLLLQNSGFSSYFTCNFFWVPLLLMWHWQLKIITVTQEVLIFKQTHNMAGCSQPIQAAHANGKWDLPLGTNTTTGEKNSSHEECGLIGNPVHGQEAAC